MRGGAWRRGALSWALALAVVLPARVPGAAPAGEPPVAEEEAAPEQEPTDDGTGAAQGDPEAGDEAGEAAPQEGPAAPPSASGVAEPEPAKKPDRKARAKARGKAAGKARRTGRRGPALRARLARGWRFEMPVRFGLAAGWTQGLRTRHVEGAAVEMDAGAAPEVRYRGDRFRVRLEGGYRRRETAGFDLPERVARGALEVSGRPHRAVELAAGAGVRRVDRADWEDEYQPVVGGDGLPSGDLLPTDRYSFLEVEAGVRIRWDASRAVSLSGAFGWRRRAYDRDPAYDDLLNPTHLVPFDRDRWRGEVEAAGRLDRWTGTLRARLDALSDPFAFARDAGTGRTHSPPGGQAANPLQRFLRVEVRHRSDVRIPEARSRVSFLLAWEHNDDRFRGYYDWHDLVAGLAVRSRPAGGLILEAGWEGRFRWHGPDGYREGPGHPPLDGGDTRRTDRWHRLRLRAAWAAWDGRVEPFVEGDFRWHDTNFPDYVPGTNPPGMPYRIDFDYRNRSVRAGVDVRF